MGGLAGLGSLCAQNKQHLSSGKLSRCGPTSPTCLLVTPADGWRYGVVDRTRWMVPAALAHPDFGFDNVIAGKETEWWLASYRLVCCVGSRATDGPRPPTYARTPPRASLQWQLLRRTAMAPSSTGRSATLTPPVSTEHSVCTAVQLLTWQPLVCAPQGQQRQCPQLDASALPARPGVPMPVHAPSRCACCHAQRPALPMPAPNTWPAVVQLSAPGRNIWTTTDSSIQYNSAS